VYESLDKLGKLREQGVITDEEFEAQKQQAAGEGVGLTLLPAGGPGRRAHGAAGGTVGL
jgi:hypothetical protein